MSLPRRHTVRLCVAVLALPWWGALAAEPDVSAAATPAQAGMREIRELAPDIALDIRYAGSDNFTGRPVPGYDAAKCYLLEPAAVALARVQAALRREGYSLQVFDCYRPAQSVKAFVDWVAAADDPRAKAAHYPNVDKRALLDGYIAGTSGHSRGATVDLTLLDCRAGACVPLDMGTGFDYFDPRAHTDAPGLSAAQAGNRRRLLQAMAAGGFGNYPMEWWHYTLRPEPAPDTAYDFPVR
ncbi:M15 family metallopeptidase [Stenotrophomonas sp. MMGLT7]|uniref:M15 family metallopeptidase n=1 Tax=Stenotrophomonas sp. MMGLT7 TaxID=2901227 RepID=UPI001E31EE31|nr:M15 family metallopeptidase [Stenotrophomonas sp. MMGLT7]MCD7097748.1 M15 family metallopeptidase [Stenotrophomonas sp. MMGLT7]